MINVPEIFGTMVFGDSEMKKRLPEEVYVSIKKTIKDGRSYRTIYDAHMILQFGRAETMSTDSHARPMMIGSYPID